MARTGDLVHAYPKGSMLFSIVPAWHDETADRPLIWCEIPRGVIGPTPWPVVVILSDLWKQAHGKNASGRRVSTVACKGRKNRLEYLVGAHGSASIAG